MGEANKQIHIYQSSFINEEYCLEFRINRQPFVESAPKEAWPFFTYISINLTREDLEYLGNEIVKLKGVDRG